MSEGGQVNVAIVGLGFGAEFIPIYQAHPQANVRAICRRHEAKLNEIGDACGIEKRYTDYDELLTDPGIDFIHINFNAVTCSGDDCAGNGEQRRTYWFSLPQQF